MLKSVRFEISLTIFLFPALILVVYLFKFAVWESGYLESMDIAHDRFGFYICWGVLSWVPGFYTIAAQYFVKHPVHMGHFEAITILGLGVLSVWVNYEADLQKQVFRHSKGNCLIWGKKPVAIHAEYKTTDGQTR
jgi:7-dehydrocholesterol reductase